MRWVVKGGRDKEIDAYRSYSIFCSGIMEKPKLGETIGLGYIHGIFEVAFREAKGNGKASD